MSSREKMVQGLVAMAAADGRIGKRERKVVEILAQRWGVDVGVIDSAIEEAKIGKGHLSVPADPGERRELLKALISVAAVDGVIEPGERSMLEAFADKAGTSRFELDQMLEATLQKRARKTGSGSGSDSVAAAPSSGAARAPAPTSLPDRAPPPVGQQAVAINLGPSVVFGAPPWKEGARVSRLCDFCTEAVPDAASVCPFCETPVGGGGGGGNKFGWLAKVGVVALGVVVFAYFQGVSEGRSLREDGQVLLDMTKPNKAQLRAAVKVYAQKANVLEAEERTLRRKREIARSKLERYENLPAALRYARELPQAHKEALAARQREFSATFQAGGK